MPAPDVSIIIPTRDCLAYLPVALHSVQAQAAPGLDFEIIVVDDGSSDGTAAWLDTARRDIPNLIVLRESGSGVAHARNAAIAAARAPLVAFLDADDWWWPGKLARQAGALRGDPSIAFSFTDYIHMTPDGLTHGTCFAYWRFHAGIGPDETGFATLPDAEARLLATNAVGTSTVVARKCAVEAAGGFAPLSSAEDWDLWLRLAARGGVQCSPAVTATYLMRKGGETSRTLARIESMMAIVRRYDGKGGRFGRAARLAKARLETARAETARTAGAPLSAALWHARAFLRAPSRRAVVAASAGAWALIRLNPPRGRN